MPDFYEIRAYGDPQPQGSMRAFQPKGARFPVVTSDNPKLKGWRKIVKAAALAHTERDCSAADPLIYGSVAAYLYFTMRRPKSIKGDVYPTSKPDLDKLARGVLDALTEAYVFEDDSRVVKLVTMKLYPNQGADALDRPGVFIRVRQALPARKD